MPDYKLFISFDDFSKMFSCFNNKIPPCYSSPEEKVNLPPVRRIRDLGKYMCR